MPGKGLGFLDRGAGLDDPGDEHDPEGVEVHVADQVLKGCLHIYRQRPGERTDSGRLGLAGDSPLAPDRKTARTATLPSPDHVFYLLLFKGFSIPYFICSSMNLIIRS